MMNFKCVLQLCQKIIKYVNILERKDNKIK